MLRLARRLPQPTVEKTRAKHSSQRTSGLTIVNPQFPMTTVETPCCVDGVAKESHVS